MNIVKVKSSLEYEMLKDLINDNQDSIYVNDDGQIVNDDTLYVLDTHSSNNDNNDLKNDKIFTRFDSFYSKEQTIDTWDTLKAYVIDHFFKRRNFLVYNPIFHELKKEEYESIILSYFKTYTPINTNDLVIIEKDESNESLIYEVAVKIPFKFFGNPIYVINKFYFDSNLNLLSSNASRDIYEDIKNNNNNTEKSQNNNLINYEINSDMVNIMNEKIIDKMKDGFTDYLVGEAYDIFNEKTEDYIDNNKEIIIECGMPKIRYIAVMKVFNKKFIIKNRLTAEYLFECSINSSNKATFKCLQCGQDGILSGDIINIYSKDSDNNKIITPMNINLKERVSDEYLANDFGYHVFKNKDCLDCSRYVCANTIIKCSSCNKKMCNDCIKPDYVVKNSDYLLHKSCAFFNKETLSFVPKNEVMKCALCKREYSNSNKYDDKYCLLCGPIVNFDSLDNSSKKQYYDLFDIHKNMFGFRSRSKQNICNETINGILFKINQKYYFLDKMKYDLEKDEIKFIEVKEEKR
ncbi:MAG: hypothetical protein ACI35W_06715 [Anaeroplasmataceae bacterium]